MKKAFRAVLTAVFVTWCTSAMAETVAVQTGEHADFSRVVLQFARPTAWTIGRTAGGYGLRLGRPDVVLDLARSFDLIPRTRITSMSAGFGGAALQIATDCACHVEAFEDRPGILVIDVHDGPPTPASRFEAMLDLPANLFSGLQGPTRAAAALLPARIATPEAESRLLSLFWKAERNPPEDQAISGLESPQPEAAEAAPADQPGSPESATLLPNAQARPAADRVELPTVSATDTPLQDPTFRLRPSSSRIGEARDVLLQELSRAAGQGLVEVVQPERPLLPTDPAPAPEPVAHLPGSEPVAEANDHVTIKAETSIDRDALLEPPTENVTPDGVACLSDDSFALSEWGDKSPPAQQIADRRQSLIGEFDAATPGAVAALARLYLYLGFGAEARETLRAFDVRVPGSDLLETMAAILDDGTPEPGRLTAMAACDGAAALWAVLAVPQLILGEPVNTKAVIRNFSGLPVHLRRLLGPKLGNRFLAIGDEATARTIQDAVTRASGDIGAEARLMNAKLQLTQDNKSAAATELAGVVAEDGSASPEALILLIETQIDQGTTVADATVDTAAALAFEHRGTPLGSQLARIEVLATAASGDFDGAFATLAVQTGVGPGAAPTELDEDLFALLETKADDATFLRHLFGATDRLVEADLSRGLRQALTARLVALGFPDQARSVLAAAPAPKAADRLLLAQIALAMNDPGAALRNIEGMTAPEAATIRADALSDFGYHARAAGAFEDAGNTTRAVSAGWRAGDLATVSALGTPQQREAVAALLPPVAASEQGPVAPGAEHQSGTADAGAATDPAVPQGPLARNRALLAESEATRASLAKLLAAFPATTPVATP